MKSNSLIRKLYLHYPKRIANNYHDYVGMMVGKLPPEIHKILLCLDFDESILEEALIFHPDLIITHHPFFYGSKNKILKKDEHKRRINDILEENHIPLFSMHTNFDGGTPGMNDALANALHLQNIYTPEKEESMRIGYLENKMNIDDFVRYTKQQLHASYALLINEGKKEIQKVAIVGGGGSYFYPFALEEGADIYLSGDISHHVRRDIIIAKYNYLDLPHEIERIFMETLKKVLLGLDKDFEIKIIDHEIEMKPY